MSVKPIPDGYHAITPSMAVMEPMADMPWGDRAGRVRDPYGNVWFIATHTEDVDTEEMLRRMGITAAE